MIPKIIHQIWIGDKTKTPYKFMETWKKMNPTWEYKIWTEENMFDLINKKQFNGISGFAGKADIMRYEILHNYGGFYIDADSECIKPLEDWLLNCDSFACWESEVVVPGLIANGYLASVKDCLLMKMLINNVNLMNPLQMDDRPPWQKTGPVLLTNTVGQYRYTNLKVYPSHYFIPKHCRGTTEYTGPDHVFCKQYWGSSFGLYGTIGR